MPVIFVHGKIEGSNQTNPTPMLIPAERYRFTLTNLEYPANPDWCQTFAIPYDANLIPHAEDPKTKALYYAHNYETLEIAESVDEIWEQIKQNQENKT